MTRLLFHFSLKDWTGKLFDVQCNLCCSCVQVTSRTFSAASRPSWTAQCSVRWLKSSSMEKGPMLWACWLVGTRHGVHIVVKNMFCTLFLDSLHQTFLSVPQINTPISLSLLNGWRLNTGQTGMSVTHTEARSRRKNNSCSLIFHWMKQLQKRARTAVRAIVTWDGLTELDLWINPERASVLHFCETVVHNFQSVLKCGTKFLQGRPHGSQAKTNILINKVWYGQSACFLCSAWTGLVAKPWTQSNTKLKRTLLFVGAMKWCEGAHEEPGKSSVQNISHAPFTFLTEKLRTFLGCSR